jgi:hypothetical protein
MVAGLVVGVPLAGGLVIVGLVIVSLVPVVSLKLQARLTVMTIGKVTAVSSPRFSCG